MYDRTFWNDRYGGDDFVFGTAPNDFLAEHAARLTGPVLSLGEGEGRNAVFLAARGLDVLGVDLSPVGLAKAARLAAAHGVAIRTEVADLATWDPPADSFGAVISIFAHLPSAVRARLYPRLVRALRPGGVLLLEAYTPAQLARTTGGPKEPDLLVTAAQLRTELAGLEPLLLHEIEREVLEGGRHSGVGAVVQCVMRRPDP